MTLTCLIRLALSAPALVVLLAPAPLLAASLAQGFRARAVGADLEQPTDFEFLPGGRILVTELRGNLRVIQDGVLQRAPLLTLAVTSREEDGLLGVVKSPTFATDHHIYLYYTTAEGSYQPAEHPFAGPKSRVSRFTLTGGAIDPASETVIVDDIAADEGNHNGGGLRFGPDGFLYVSTGDGGARQENSQDLGNLNGKILRVHPGGSIPADNPFAAVEGARGEIWCYGLRNVWRFAWDAAGRLFAGDVGTTEFEEINICGPGENHGWPFREGPVELLPGGPFVDPVYSYHHDDHPIAGAALAAGRLGAPLRLSSPHSGESAVPSAVAVGDFYTGTVYPAAYRGALFWADFARGVIATLSYDAASGTATTAVFGVVDDSPVTFRMGPDGLMYYLAIYPRGQLYVLDFIGDTDGDGISDEWERQMGLDPTVATGGSGPTGDPDGDGLTNLQEFTAGTHPRGTFTRYFAEGATGFFDLRIALANPGVAAANVLLRFLKADGTAVPRAVVVPARGRATVDARSIAGMASAEFSTVIESDTAILASRTMTWSGAGYGSHSETAVAAPAPRWYLAEGATHSGFQLFYLIQNPGAVAADVDVEYLPASGAPILRSYRVPAASRYTIWANADASLANAELSATITSRNQVPIIVERAMYRDSGGLIFGAGDDSAGVTAPSLTWYFAEGATGPFFDTFVLLANPSTSVARVRVRFLLPSGATIAKTYEVAPRSRRTVWADQEDAALTDTAFATVVESTNGVGIIAERAMWWPGPTAASWAEAHNSPGAPAPAARWGMANGELGGVANAETFITIANTSSVGGSVRITLLMEDGTTLEKVMTIGGTSRLNVDVGAEFPAAANRRFGAVAEAIGVTPLLLVVECSVYSDASGVRWAAGTNELATPLPVSP